MKQILIITSSIDETASYVVNKCRDISRFHRLDVDKFDDYYIDIDNYGWNISCRSFTISLKDITAIYYRKPMFPDLKEFEAQYHAMIQKDIVAVVNGIVESFEGKVLSKPSVLRKTENKIFQLALANKIGFCIPDSYIGNNKIQCEKFKKNNSIIKPLTTGKTYGKNGWEIYQTSIFRGIEDDISITPIYLQEYIPKQYEVRITIIDKEVYVVRIDTDNKIDWRMDYSNHVYTEIICPQKIIEQCYQLLECFQLSFGAFDFIVTPENEWIFLEVNPNGQWLWLEKSLKLDISKKIVDYLITE